MMCDLCCMEFRGWCKSFTRTELFLAVLEFVLLIIFTVLLGFTILHFIVCSKKDYVFQESESATSTSTVQSLFTTEGQCTWKESEKTSAATHYYDQEKASANTTSTVSTGELAVSSEFPQSTDIFDGEDAQDVYKEVVLALVKINPPRDVIFGCILVKIARYWMVTAASCIEAIEEVDSLDSFIIMEGYGEPRPGKSHPVADVRIHPLYEGTNRSYDLAALRSEDRLGEAGKAVTLPTTSDNYFTVIGERLTLLGYGRYRSPESPGSRRGLRAVPVWVSAAARCAPAGGWATRHLARPRPAPPAGCGARVLCCTPRAAPDSVCNYCGGSPLLAGARLLGIMSDNPQCGVSCEPAPFVNVAAPIVRGWLAAVAAV